MNNSNQTNSDNANGSLRLDGKTALVTGAAGGLGQSFTRCLVEAGASVIVSGRRERHLNPSRPNFRNMLIVSTLSLWMSPTSPVSLKPSIPC